MTLTFNQIKSLLNKFCFKEDMNLQDIIDIFLNINGTTNQELILEWLFKTIPKRNAIHQFKKACCQINMRYHFFYDTPRSRWLIHYDSVFTINKSVYITVGDELCLLSMPKIWWKVHEIRAGSSSLLLVALCQSRMWYKDILPILLCGCKIRRQLPNTQNICLEFSKLPIAICISRLQNFVASQQYHNQDILLLGNKGNDALVTMHRTANVKEWIDTKSFEYRCISILEKIPTTLASSTFCWFRIAFLLRTVSDSLLPHWLKWCKQIVLNSATESQSRKVWSSLQLNTNCNDSSVCEIRNVLTRRLIDVNNDMEPHFISEVYFNTDLVCLNLYKWDKILLQDAFASAIIQDAAIVLRNDVLEFWKDEEGIGNSKVKVDTKRRVPRRSIDVPCAIYSMLSSSLKENSTGEFEDMHQYAASIMVGDLIHLLIRRTSEVKQWYRVYCVDLLFARLKVGICDPPPYGLFREEETESQSSFIWIPISLLWKTVVCTHIRDTNPSHNLR